jgi:hypothetical protein
MLAIATNVLDFTELPNRRVMAQFGQVTNLTCVYQGMEYFYSAWSPRRGSPHPDYPSMFLATISREDRGGGLIEVSLTYQGTLLQQQHYTDLAINIDLLTQSFSWSGPASWKGVAVQFTFDSQYVTLSVSFAYTAYQYLSGAIFQSMASGFVQIMDVFTNITTAPLSPGYYTGFPTIPTPIKPLLMLTRFNCQQQTPSKKTTENTPDVVNSAGIWKCTETWQLNYNHGSLGFYEPNDVSSQP